MRNEHVFHVGLTERQPQLQNVLGVAAQKCDFAPVEVGWNNQSVEPVDFSLAGKGGHEALFEAIGHGLGIDFLAALVSQVKVLNPEWPAVR